VPGMNQDLISVPIKMTSVPEIKKNKITTALLPGEIIVLYFGTLNVK
jgi:hypothetical protein